MSESGSDGLSGGPETRPQSARPPLLPIEAVVAQAARELAERRAAGLSPKVGAEKLPTVLVLHRDHLCEACRQHLAEMPAILRARAPEGGAR